MPPQSKMVPVGWAVKLKFCKNKKCAKSFENAALQTVSCTEQASPDTGLLMSWKDRKVCPNELSGELICIFIPGIYLHIMLHTYFVCVEHHLKSW